MRILLIGNSNDSSQRFEGEVNYRAIRQGLMATGKLSRAEVPTAGPRT